MVRLITLMLLICATAAHAMHQESSRSEDHKHRVFVGINNNSYKNGTIEVYWNNLIRSVEVKAYGDIELSDNEADVKTMSKNGYLLIKERNWLTYRELEITVDASGAMQRHFSIQGRGSEFDKDAQAWLVRILPDLARQTGIGARTRIQKIIERQGLDAAIEEMSLTESNGAVQVYFEAITGHPGLNSDGMKKAVARVAKEISSSSRLQDILTSAAKRFPEDSVLTASLIEATKEISSSSGQAESLIAIANLRRLDNISAVAMAKAIREISSSSAQGHALEVLADLSPTNSDAFLEYLRTVESVSSSSQQGHALKALLRRKDLGRDVFAKTLEAIEGISSSSIQGEILTSVSLVCPSDDEILAAYLKTAGEIASSSQQEEAVMAMLDKKDISVNILTRTLDFANNEMSSSSARKNVSEKVTRLLAEKAAEKK
jgi:hypothetical protein